MKRWIAVFAVLALCAGCLLLAGCGAAEEEPETTAATTAAQANTTTEQTEDTTVADKTDATETISQYPVVTITMMDGGVITAELYYDKAPNTVLNFISLVQSGYYDGKVFHRAVPGFMIQGGSPDGTSSSVGFPYAIKGEFSANGFAQNTIKHTAGVLSMARINASMDSASCQFFIMHGTEDYLDGQYAAFGKVTSGMEIVDQIATSPASNQMLHSPVAMRSVTVDTHGVKFPEPVTIPN